MSVGDALRSSPDLASLDHTAGRSPSKTLVLAANDFLRRSATSPAAIQRGEIPLTPGFLGFFGILYRT